MGQGTPVGSVFGGAERLTTHRDSGLSDPVSVSKSEFEEIAVVAPIIREALKRTRGQEAIEKMDAFVNARDYAAEHDEEEEQNMTDLRKETLQLLEKYEARKFKPYICPAGHWTIGIGHNLEAEPVHGWNTSDPTNLTLNDQQIDKLLEKDIAKVEAQMPRLGLPDNLPEVAKEVVIRMCFQMGVGGVMAFRSMLNALSQDPPGFQWAAQEMRDSKWWRTDSPSRAEDEARRVEALAA